MADAGRGFRWLLVALIAVCLLAGGLPLLLARVHAEQADTHLEMIADFREFALVARAQNQDPQAFLRQLRARGVTSLGVRESSLYDLDQEGLLTAMSGGDLLDRSRLGQKPPVPAAQLDPGATYVFGFQTGAPQAWVYQALTDRLGAGRVSQVGGVVVVVGDPVQVSAQTLGYPPGELAGLAALGFDIVLRPQNGPGLDDAAIARYFDAAAAEAPLHTVVFDGSEAMGYPNHLQATARALAAHHLVLGAIETPTQLGNVDQKGIAAINQASGQRAVRLYSIPPWVIGKLPPPDVTTDVLTAVEDRHMRAVYLHPFTVGLGADQILPTNLSAYADMTAALRRHGFTLGPAQPMPVLSVGRAERLLLCLGAAAGGLLLLSLFFPGVGWAWLVALGLLALAFAFGSAGLSREVAALGAASVFPSLGALVVARLWRHPPRRIYRAAAATAIATAAVSFIGALFVATLLGDTPHLLEWTFFRGVKLSFVLPPLVAFAGYLLYTGEEGFGRTLLRFGDYPLAVKHLVIGAALLGAGGLYLLRSGNVTSIPGLEQHLRLFLEQTLVYRPREKEFLVGYPSLFLAAFFAHRRQPGLFLIFLLGASAGQVSLVNSFEHLRTPFLTSFWRGLYGLIVGLGVGSLVLGIAAGAFGWWDRRRRAS